jgi:hypothetical protein
MISLSSIVKAKQLANISPPEAACGTAVNNGIAQEDSIAAAAASGAETDRADTSEATGKRKAYPASPQQSASH